MSWSVTYDPATTIVEVVYTGSVNGAELKAAVSERVRLQNEHDSLAVLLDCSQLERLAGGLFDVHALPDEIYGNAKVNRRTCHAMLLPSDPLQREAPLHYETACLNRGWRVKSFETRQEATSWLLEQRGPDTTRGTPHTLQ